MEIVKPAASNEVTEVEIEVEGLSKAFGEHQVLTGIDLCINRGDIVAIVGGSGCGKTVLLNHILGQLKPDTGHVRVADYNRPGAPLVDLAEVDAHELDAIHTHWGVVFQRNALFSGSVYANFALWLREVRNLTDDDIEPIARRALDAVSLPDDEEFMESDVDSLSGGMAKRLAIARALSMDPNVIFYDEPTTGLDPTSAAQVQDLIFETHVGDNPDHPKRTTLIITHDKDLLVRLEPRVVMLHEGLVHFDGPYSEFEAAPSPVIRPYFDLMPTLHQRVRAAG
ncbi:MAG: ATP-binding cassette domain-containing protein [Rhodospirillales bacterium]|nr:ATP-binding cassette domain-containing protein [Rhodospirillales bacterium]MBO6787140.1 ATP-binding cassette domain-containing protein [Rhodospirillales bacterium]